VLKLSIKNILDKKVRFALTGFSIVLGVAFVVSSFVVKDSIGSTFDKLVTDIQGDIDLTVRTKLDFGQDQDRPPVPASTLDTVRATEGVAAAVPRLFSDKVAPVKADGEQVKTQGPPTIGINWADDDRLSQLFLVDGRKPAGPDEFALDITSAKDNGFVVGQRYTVVGPITKREMTLVGTAAFASKKNDTVGAVLTIFDTSTAQAFTCACKDYGDVAMRLDNPDDAASVIPRLEKNLANPNLEILTKSEAIKEGQDNFGQITNIIGTVLLVFAVIAVLVSAFIINNTFQIVLGQRVRELALLRALGASARQVGRSVVTEAFVLGAVATAVGTAAGVVLAIGLKACFVKKVPA
jgi:putative ABC transport system permease protein